MSTPCPKGGMRLSEALDNMQLAYNPITKQLHFVSPKVEKPPEDSIDEVDKLSKKSSFSDEGNYSMSTCEKSDTSDSPKSTLQWGSVSGHQRGKDGGSFSSTVSSLSECSLGSSASKEDEIGEAASTDQERCKLKKKGLSSFFSRNKSVSPIGQLLCALRFYATGNHLIAVADMGGISVATCSRIVKRVSKAIVTLRHDYIKLPNTHEEREHVKQKFYRIARFPNVIGCIDCTHVKIQSPGGDDAELFRNRKSFMSINVQTISDADLLVMDVVARWPGSTHDSTIYQSSNIFRKFERGDYRGAYLLGDSGYPLKSHLLTPYLNPITRGQQKYNEAQIKTRNVVERQYGVLKRRFPVLAVGIRLKLATAIDVILACCILHNICIIRKEQEPLNDGSIPNLEALIETGRIPRIPITVNDPIYGFQRNQITNYFENM